MGETQEIDIDYLTAYRFDVQTNDEWAANMPCNSFEAAKSLVRDIDAMLESEFTSPHVGITAQARQSRWHTYPDD